MSGTKEGENGLLAQMAWFMRALKLFGEGIAKCPGRSRGRDDQMASMMWARNAMVCRCWEARRHRRCFEECCIFSVRPASE